MTSNYVNIPDKSIIDSVYHPIKIESMTDEFRNKSYRHIQKFAEELFETEKRINLDEVDQSIKLQINEFKEHFESSISKHKKIIDNAHMLPKIVFSDPKDGSIVAEWASPDIRFGFIFESNPKDSSWFFVTNEKFDSKIYTSKSDSSSIQEQLDFGISLLASNI